MAYNKIVLADEEKKQINLTEAEEKVWNLLQDLSRRSGLNDMWDEISDDIQDQIFKKWVEIIS